MRGTIRIGTKDVDMVANGATPFIYKRVFRRDFLATTQTEDMDVYTELAFIMAQQADPTITDELSWLDRFEDFDPWAVFYQLMDLISSEQEIAPKNA